MNKVANTKSLFILIVGDLISYLFSLVVTLALRYGEIPSRGLLINHLTSFSVLFLVFILVNFSAGLYDKQFAFIRDRILGLIFRVQIVNIVIGIIFFYLAPVAIAPKANLVIFFIVSTTFLLIWRFIMFPVLTVTRKQNAILLGEGDDIEDIYTEVNGGTRYSIYFTDHIKPSQSGSLDQTLKESLSKNNISLIVADMHSDKIESILPLLYSNVYSGIQFIDASKLYETIFDRIPISMLGERWFLEHSSVVLGTRRTYDTIKRITDILISIVSGAVSLIFYPLIIAAIKMDDKGPIFITQERVGKNGKKVVMRKFRTMTGNDQGKYGASGTTQNVVTRVGKFLRVSRIDELPQLWNVFLGDLSLIGPRPEFPALTAIYEKEIPYYNSRHLVKPGLSGWAQIYHEAHPHHAVATEETRNKLSYDLYYIKNRSLLLDLKITLRTIQILMSRIGK